MQIGVGMSIAKHSRCFPRHTWFSDCQLGRRYRDLHASRSLFISCGRADGSRAALNYISLDVGGPDALSEWKTKLAAKDIDWRADSREECLERQVAGFSQFNPDGYPLALSYGFESGKEPVRYTRELMVTGLRHEVMRNRGRQCFGNRN